MAEDKKRSTVNVHNKSGRSLMLHLHQTIADDGGGRAFQGRVLDGVVTLDAGHNPRIDKEFFEKWKEQNKGSALLALFTFEDEDNEPESAERKE